MADISNNTLVTIVLFALAVTLLGTWVLYGKIQATGLTASPTGTVSASVYETTDIALKISAVTFSNVSIDFTYRTDGNTAVNHSGAEAFLLRNDGSVTANVTLYAGDSLWVTQTGNSSYYRFNVTNATGNTTAKNCSGSSPNHNVWYNVPVGAGSVATKAVCIMDYTNNNDYANISIEITVPSGESSGGKSSEVVFTATQS